MGRKLMILLGASLALVLLAQPAVAGTKIYVNFGVPVVDFEVRGGGPYNDNYRVEGFVRFEPVERYPGHFRNEGYYRCERVVPSPHHVWVEGYYHYDRPRYVWVPGHWVVVSEPHAMYVPGHPKKLHNQHQNWGRGNDRWEHGD